MQKQTLELEPRETAGKGGARQLRMAGRLPGIVYGHGVEPTPVSVQPKALQRALATEFGRNQLLELKLEGREDVAIVKELQVDPIDRHPVHVDFYSVDLTKPISVNIPLHATGRSKGVLAGGQLNVCLLYTSPSPRD